MTDQAYTPTLSTSQPDRVFHSDNITKRNETQYLTRPEPAARANKRPNDTVLSFRGGGHTFGRARNVGPVPGESRRVRRSIAAFIAYLGRAAIARLIDLLAAICRAVKVALVPADYDYTWQGDTNDYPFDTQWFLTPRQKLAAKSLAKQSIQEVPMVVTYHDPQSRPASGVPVLSTALPYGHREWASASPTPGLPSTINLKAVIDGPAALKAAHPEWRIGSSARWNGAQ